jgi:hypothetical protein
MNRLKFLDARVDEAVHREAHQAGGARKVGGEAGCNWAYLSYDWGFPPEVEQEDWEDFRRAVQVYHGEGVRVFGYIQTSNCVYAGSYRDKDWYALDRSGRPFYYYTGRYMVCWLHPEWRAHLRAMVEGIVGAGADGVFFDNPWHGSQPFYFGRTWLGPAGCYCARCREAFMRESGEAIPAAVAPETDEASRRYLAWRAGIVTQTLTELAAHARRLRPDVVVSVNNFDAVMRPSHLIYGIDLAALAGVQDVLMIEDYGLPRWDGVHLVNNALTLRAARALGDTTPVSTNPYDKGIGLDGVYVARRFQQGIAEAAACGAAMVVKGTEYVGPDGFTLLTAEPFGAQRDSIGHYNRWLRDHADMFAHRRNKAAVGLLHPGHRLWQDWSLLAPLYFAAGQTLLVAGVPWRVVATPHQLDGVEVLLCVVPPPSDLPLRPGMRVIDVRSLAGWSGPPPSLLSRRPALRSAASGLVAALYRSYFTHRLTRRVVDRFGLVHFFAQLPYYRVPASAQREALLSALGPKPHPFVEAPAPVLVELWQAGDTYQLHLVNYADDRQQVRVEFGRSVTGETLSPGGTGQAVRGDRTVLDLDIYTVVVYRGAGET